MGDEGIYAAAAVGLIVLGSGLLLPILKWAQQRGYLQERGLLWLTLAVFLIIFLTNIVRAFHDPLPKAPFDAVIQWTALVGLLVIVAISGVRVARMR